MMAAGARAAQAAAPGFIQATEVWVPNEAGDALVRASGVYGALDDFAAASAEECFAIGEGLPGRAWAERRPVVLKALEAPVFRRAEAARAAGLTAAVAIPVFAGRGLKGVLVFLCADDAARIGAVEVWRSGPDETAMVLEDGYYGAATHFEWISKRTQFPPGQGLPGGVWASGVPMMLRDLGGSHRFIRAESAGEAGLTTGLGLPVRTPGDTAYVLTLLSARATPIAGRFELWEVQPGRGGMPAEAVLVDGLCVVDGPLWGTPKKAQPWRGPVGRALATGAPLAATGADAAGLPADYGSIVALPIHRGGAVAHIAAWYF